MPLTLIWRDTKNGGNGNFQAGLDIIRIKIGPYNVSLHSRRKRERGRGARTREKNGVLGAFTPATQASIMSNPA